MRSTKRLLQLPLYALALLYLATWVWGVPATHTEIARRVIVYYKEARALQSDMVREHHPRLRFGASYAVLPLVIVNHYEYQVAGAVGWGGVELDVWYVKGTAPIAGYTKWIS